MQRLILLALLAMTVVAGGLPTPVSAAAMPVDLTFCHAETSGYTTCVTLQGITTETLTPAGNASYTGSLNETQVGRFSDGTLDYESTSRIHFHNLQQDQMLHVLGNQLTSTRTNADGTTCVTTYRAHFANGQYQFEHTETVCE